ncbi:unnamed protein product [Rhizophagus irregularis]|nr:unnamed protein product [Rhizophagus irregularis]CAB5325182.1 unnamed protein product [Rhizophagus irregularis]
MGRTIARTIIFVVATFLMLYSISVAALTFSKINITAFHLSQPLLIGYGVFWLIVAPSGLWGIFGSTQDNTDLCNRYLRDHWFSSAVISTVDIIKIVFSFTMKDNSIQKCLNETPTGNCGKKVDFSQKAGLIAFGVQGFLMVGLGLLVWFSCRQLSKKKDEKVKVELGHGLETQNTRQLNDDDTINLRVEDRVETNPLSSFKDRRPSQYSKGQKGQNEQKIKKDNENVVRSREEQGSIKNANNVDVKNADINNTNNVYNVDNIKNVNNINNIRNVNNIKNIKNVQGFDQQQYTTPLRPRKSSDRQMTPSDELQGYPPQGMNQTAPVNRSKNMAPPVRSNSSRFPPPQPEYRFIPSIQPPQGVKGMQKSRAPIPPSFYYNRPPFPQYQQMSNFPPMYPWQQQWPGYNNRPIPPQGDFRGHRRSKSQPELRPLPFLPRPMDYQIPSNPPQIPRQKQAIPSQIIERQQKIPIDSKNKYNNENKSNNNSQNTSAASSRRSSTSSRRRSSVNDKRPYSQMHRTNSLPNLSNHEDLMRNEMLFAPPVPLIPSNLQSNTKNSNKDDKSDNKNTRESQPPIINNDDKLERFIKMYGDKEYNMYNRYSQYRNSSWSTNDDDDDYVPPKRQRPKSAQSVQGEASPKSSIYVEDGYYNDYYYGPPLGGPPLGYNNYVYPQYSGPIGYNNGENFVQSNPMNYNGGWVNYGQQRPQRMNYYY